MAKTVERTWTSNLTSGLPRRDRMSCKYEPYIPDLLNDERKLTFEAQVVAEMSDAEAAIRNLNSSGGSLADTEALARLLLHAESVASSKIEGLVVGGKRLLKTEFEQQLGLASTDITAIEVLANVNAMNHAVNEMADGQLTTVEDICEVHRQLMFGTELEHQGGVLRQEQNWIGGSSYNPCSAAFVPPPPEFVPDLLQDLCDFINSDLVPPIAQAALAHSQFETIHPFSNGNGRTGRALIHVVLRRRGLISRLVPLISLVLATRSTDYIAGLMATRYKGKASSSEAMDGIGSWTSTFAAACTRSVHDATLYDEQITDLTGNWMQRLGKVRVNSSVEQLLKLLPAAPLVTVQSAAVLINRSDEAARIAVDRLVEVGILEQTTIGKRNRAFCANEVIDAFTDLERRLASPNANTKLSPPARRVPARRQ